MIAAFRVNELPTVSWKNGRGVTRQLSIGPPGAGLETFAWRVTLADIECGPVPFSYFAGIDRTTVLTGPGLRLARLAQGAFMAPVEPFTPLALSGEEPIDAQLRGDPVQAFNLMVRRGLAWGALDVYRASAAIALDAQVLVCFCARGRAAFAFGDKRAVTLESGDAFEARAKPPGTCHLRCENEDTVVVIAGIQPAK